MSAAAARMLTPSGGQRDKGAKAHHAAADESGAGKQPTRSKEEAWLDGIINSPGSPLSRRMLKRKRSFKAAAPSPSETANQTEESKASDAPVGKEKGGGAAASGNDNPRDQQSQQQTSTKKTKKAKKKGKKKTSSASLVEPAAQPTHKANGEGGQQQHNETVENGAQGSNNSSTEDASSAAAAVVQLEGIVDKLMERHNPNASSSSSSPPSDHNNDQPQPQLSRQQLRKERTIKQRAEAVEKDLTSLVYSILMPLFSLNYSLRDLVDFDDVASSPADLPPQLRALLSSSPSSATAANNAQNKRPTKKQRTKSKNGDEEKQPGKLKKPRSAYHFFCLEYGPIIQSESERPLGFGERAKLLGAKWRQVCEEGGALKQKFDEQAEEDRERYLREALELSATEDGGSGNTNVGKARSRSGSERRKSLSTTDPASLMKMIEKEGPILIRPRRMSGELLEELGKQAVLVDITPSSTDNRWRKFGLAYPHGMIPIPGHENKWSMSVEGLYEGLKVFERAGVDRSVMTKTSMKGLRRQEHRNGPLLGWATSLKQKPTKLMAVKEARWKLLLPAYKTVLERHLLEEVAELRQMLDEGKRLVILDGQTNADLCNYEKDVSAAALLKRYLEGRWPSSEEEEQEELQRRRSKEEEEEKQKQKEKGKGKEVAATVENRTKQTEGHSDKKEKKYEEEEEEEKQTGKSSMQLEERGEGGSSTGALSSKKKKRGSKRKRETVPPLTLQKI